MHKIHFYSRRSFVHVEKSHIWCETKPFNDDVAAVYIRRCHPVASQSEIFAYRWFKVTGTAKKKFLLSLSYRETFS